METIDDHPEEILVDDQTSREFLSQRILSCHRRRQTSSHHFKMNLCSLSPPFLPRLDEENQTKIFDFFLNEEKEKEKEKEKAKAG